MCRVTVKPDIKIIFYHLIFNRVITLDNQNQIVGNPAFDPAQKMIGYIPESECDQSSGIPNLFSLDFTKALQKAVHWVRVNRALPRQGEAFLRCLEQVCTFKREASLDSVLEALARKEYIRCNSVDGELVYSLPSRHPSPEVYSHFRPEQYAYVNA